MTENPLTSYIFNELDACRCYQTLVNDLDPEPIIARLAPDVRYVSHWVLEELTDSESVAKLLRGKVAAARGRGGADHEAQLCASTTLRWSGMPVIALVSCKTQCPEAVVGFEIANGLITAIHICILDVYKPARLDNPDRYEWPRTDSLFVEAKTKASAVSEPAELDPDPASIIATFADVERNYFAVINDAAIAERPCRTWGNIKVTLVPPDDAGIMACDFPGVAEAREAAARMDLLLFLLSRVDGDAFGIATIPRASAPWIKPDMNKMAWHMRDGHKPAHFFDFDAYCELQMFAIGGLLYRIAPVVMRRRPEMPIAELERRYREVEKTSTGIIDVGISYDLSTWPRFLEHGASAASSLAANGGLPKLRERGEDLATAALVLEAWVNVAQNAA